MLIQNVTKNIILFYELASAREFIPLYSRDPGLQYGKDISRTTRAGRYRSRCQNKGEPNFFRYLEQCH